MNLEETYEVLRNFAKNVRKRARYNLTRGNKNVSKSLYDSLDYDTKAMPNSLSMSFFMDKHGIFQDRGVRGTKSGKSLDNFSYKQSSNLMGFEAATGTFAKWAKFRRIQPRDKKGRFGSYKTMGFILANSIKKKGIKPSMFFTKPFEQQFKNLPKELIEAYGLDLENFINFTIKDNLNG